MDSRDKELIREIVNETIKELMRNGMLKSVSDMAYSEITDILKGYYDTGETDKSISKVLEAVSGDPYFKIIPLYFSYGYTIEEIAEAFDVEISTISRNKKRLCLDIYNRLE